ncbi:MAG: hypothetical protein M3081_00815 [Gemmatimonadota bacterium]|nr:hypothetical protein [Gemmatimonadota bacterium]
MRTSLVAALLFSAASSLAAQTPAPAVHPTPMARLLPFATIGDSSSSSVAAKVALRVHHGAELRRRIHADHGHDRLFPLFSKTNVELDAYANFFNKTASVYTGIVGVIVGYDFAWATGPEGKASAEDRDE